MVRGVESHIKVARGTGELPLTEGAAGICQRVMEVKVAYNKMRVRKERKKPYGWYGAVGRTVSTKKVHRGDPEGVVGGSKKSLQRKDIH